MLDKLKIIIIGASMAILTACASNQTPNVAAFGKYGQFYVNDQLVFQQEYDSAAECGDRSNNQIGLTPSARDALIKGSMRIACAQVSAVDILPYKGLATEIITNRNIEVRFRSAGACSFLVKEMVKHSPGYTYKC